MPQTACPYVYFKEISKAWVQLIGIPSSQPVDSTADDVIAHIDAVLSQFSSQKQLNYIVKRNVYEFDIRMTNLKLLRRHMTDDNLLRNLSAYTFERNLKRQPIKNEKMRDQDTIDLSKEFEEQ
jgi:hypothetical protein